MNQEGQTAVGRMRCMACGREIPQVAGAETELEVLKKLGPAPNSVATRGKGSNSQMMYTTKEGFDFFDTYAPVARITTIRLILALASIHKLLIHQKSHRHLRYKGFRYRGFLPPYKKTVKHDERHY